MDGYLIQLSRSSYPDTAGFSVHYLAKSTSAQIPCFTLDRIRANYCGQHQSNNLPMQHVDYLTDAEPTVCASQLSNDPHLAFLYVAVMFTTSHNIGCFTEMRK